MRLRLSFAALLALLVALPFPAAASIAKLGSGSSVTCDATPAAGSDLDDTSVSNAYIRDIVCTNAGTTTVYVGGSGVGASGTLIAPGGTYKAQLGASVVPQCYAATSTTISCVEALGSSEFDVPASAGGSRVELLASGTDTTLNATSTLLFSTLNVGSPTVHAPLPAWCHTIQFEIDFNTFDDGSATAAGWQILFGGARADGAAAVAASWAATAAITPSALYSAFLRIGRDSPSAAYGATSTSGGGGNIIAYGNFLPRNFRISRIYSTAPAVDGAVAAPWRLYCIGG